MLVILLIAAFFFASSVSWGEEKSVDTVFSWLTAGPFPETREGETIEDLFERDCVNYDPSGTVELPTVTNPVSGKTVPWQGVGLGAALSGVSQGVGYVACDESEKAAQIVFWTNERCRVWLNDSEIYYSDASETFLAIREHRAEVSLRKGENVFLFKLLSKGYASGINAQVLLPTYWPIDCVYSRYPRGDGIDESPIYTLLARWHEAYPDADPMQVVQSFTRIQRIYNVLYRSVLRDTLQGFIGQNGAVSIVLPELEMDMMLLVIPALQEHELTGTR